ncbi:MAG: immunoglobulin-like domain-containing protein [Bacteroidia bacterium]
MLKKTIHIILVFIAIFLLNSCFKPDKNPPKIFLSGSLQIQIPINSNYIEPGYKAIDDRDGDLSYLVEITDSINTSLAKYYFVYYNVTDASGNKANQAYRIVEVYHTSQFLTDVYNKNTTCFNSNVLNDNVTINYKGGSNTDLRINGLIEIQRTLNGYIYGNNKRKLKIPIQSFTDTTFYGDGQIDEAGNKIEIILHRQINSITDTCNIILTRYQ